MTRRGGRFSAHGACRPGLNRSATACVFYADDARATRNAEPVPAPQKAGAPPRQAGLPTGYLGAAGAAARKSARRLARPLDPAPAAKKERFPQDEGAQPHKGSPVDRRPGPPERKNQTDEWTAPPKSRRRQATQKRFRAPGPAFLPGTHEHYAACGNPESKPARENDASRRGRSVNADLWSEGEAPHSGTTPTPQGNTPARRRRRVHNWPPAPACTRFTGEARHRHRCRNCRDTPDAQMGATPAPADARPNRLQTATEANRQRPRRSCPRPGSWDWSTMAN